jgi:hypothetical protein
MGSGVAVGGSGVIVAVGVTVGSGGKNEAHAESPSAKKRVKSIRMGLRGKNIAPNYKLKHVGSGSCPTLHVF